VDVVEALAGTGKTTVAGALAKPAWIYAAARSGKLTCVRIGRNVRLLRSDLEQFVAQQRGR